MECNKDEAVRSKGIAEAKFSQHDLVGARKFALKARQLFPELDGLPQFISVLDVHIVAQDKLQSGETNWYGILQVDPAADESTIRKQYRKLALLLHPDKNKSVGSEAAFQYISEAWGVLSDKAKKAAHDVKRNARAPQSSKVVQHKEPAPNGYHKATRPPKATQPQRHTRPQPPPAPAPPQSPPDMKTFWTACPACKMQFEYQRLFESKNLCCPVCYKPFVATEAPFIGGTTLWPPQQQESCMMNAGRQDHPPNGFANGGKSSTFVNGSIPWPPFESVAAAHAFHAQMKERARKEDKEVQAPKGVKKKEQKRREKERTKAKAAVEAKEAFARLIAKSKEVIEQKLSSDKVSGSECKVAADKTTAFGCVRPEQFAASAQQAPGVGKGTSETAIPVKVAGSSDGKNEGKANRAARENGGIDQLGTPSTGISKGESRKPARGKKHASGRLDHETQDVIFTAKKARLEQCPWDEQVLEGELPKEFQDFQNSDSKWMGSAKVTRMPNAAVETDFPAGEHPLQKDCSLNEFPQADKEVPTRGEIPSPIPDAAAAMNVPDADFYDFDKDRTEHHFLLGQIWAAYDDDDGMPRYYARIGKVISQQPFKIQMSWLEARSPSDETIAWLDSGFSYSSGEFKLGGSITSEHINTFSHPVTFEKGQRGGFKIYPRKGDVWALYKDWDTLKTKDAKRGYEMIEVLTDYSDEVGVQVAFLCKIEGYKTLFKRKLGAQDVQWINSKEMRMFSHQVPAHSVAAEQVQGIQEGCWELDPASTPMDMITGQQV